MEDGKTANHGKFPFNYSIPAGAVGKIFHPENRDEFDQKVTKKRKRTLYGETSILKVGGSFRRFFWTQSLSLFPSCPYVQI